MECMLHWLKIFTFELMTSFKENSAAKCNICFTDDFRPSRRGKRCSKIFSAVKLMMYLNSVLEQLDLSNLM